MAVRVRFKTIIKDTSRERSIGVITKKEKDSYKTSGRVTIKRGNQDKKR